MIFPGTKPLRVVSTRTFEKEGKAYNVVKLADEETYENNDFFVPNGIDPRTLTPGSRFNVALDVQGRFTSIIMTPVAAK